ncbi:MAG: YHYH protein, partial [Alphaproteobacteria bacterium]|nr:YHYH protein [Alphaproteobacteria bacterium]
MTRTAFRSTDRSASEPQRAAGELVELRSGYRLRLGTRAGGPGGAHDGTFVEDWEQASGLGDLDFC